MADRPGKGGGVDEAAVGQHLPLPRPEARQLRLRHVTGDVADISGDDDAAFVVDYFRATKGERPNDVAGLTYDAVQLVAQALEAAGRAGEGIVITGIDANPQAREAIAKGGPFEASMAQDFKGIGRTVADAVKRYLAGEKIKQSVIYVPTKLITAQNAKD